LRSLEEFWKNLHVQIPSKSPCKNPQNLAKFQKSIEIQKSNLILNSPLILAQLA
jgi:hypothetical protein